MLVNKDPVADRIREVYPYKVDLTNCDVEPLHHIQVVQSQTCLLAVHVPDQIVHFISDNSEERIGIAYTDLLGKPMDHCLSPDIVAQVSIGLNRLNGFQTLNPLVGFFTVNGEKVMKNLIVSQTEDYLIIEIEPGADTFRSSAYQLQLGQAVQRIQSLEDSQTLFAETASVLRKLTGYDRVMVYRFDEEYNGEVIAESCSADIVPYLGLRYPHTDIPKQARELYLKNRIRIIGNTADVPSRIMVADDAPTNHIDLTLAHARGVSPVHVEYLTNMGVNSSMSIAIVVDNKLWGLFAMHNYRPIFLDYQVRSFLLFIGQVFSGHLAIQSVSRFREDTLTQNMIRGILGEQITNSNDVFQGLVHGRYNLLSILPGTVGTALSFEGEIQSIGDVPSTEAVEALSVWVREQEDTELMWSSSQLDKDYPMAGMLAPAAGAFLLFLDSAKENYIVWFRPEVVQQVRWGGRPVKQILETPDGSHRLSPRKSFTQYVERVEGCSTNWTQKDIDAALALRAHIKDVVLRRYNEVQQINTDLRKAYEEMESFSYTVSHDLRAPLRAIDGYAEILEEDFGDKLGADGQDLIHRIQTSTGRMNLFINDLLELTRVGRTGLSPQPVDVKSTVYSIYEGIIQPGAPDKEIELTVADDLPPVTVDERLLRQLFLNLLTNAVKYGAPAAEGKLRLTVAREPSATGERIISVANSGMPIPAQFHRSIFEIFSRISTRTDVEGTGIGLAIVSRIMERHGGSVSVDPNYQQGAKFLLNFGKRKE